MSTMLPTVWSTAYKTLSCPCIINRQIFCIRRIRIVEFAGNDRETLKVILYMVHPLPIAIHKLVEGNRRKVVRQN